MQSKDYRIGSIIEYAAFGGEIRQVLVITKDEDIKNGRPGFDGELPSEDGTGATVWGYDSQITKVVEF